MKLLAAAALLMALTIPAFAQDERNAFRRYEIGYNVFSYSRQGSDNSFGGDLSLTRYSSDRLGFVGEIALHQKTTSITKRTTSAYRFGPRFILMQGKRVRVFGEVLAGGSRIATSSSPTFVGGSTNGFAFAVGGGVDAPIRPWLTIRPAHLDYSLFRISGVTSNGMRIGSGVLFRFGR